MGLGGAGEVKNFSVGICDGAPSTVHSSLFYIGCFLNMNCIGVVPITQNTHLRNINSKTQGSSPNVVRVVFHTLRESIGSLSNSIL